jgi:preprotein translocase subunit YajC
MSLYLSFTLGQVDAQPVPPPASPSAPAAGPGPAPAPTATGTQVPPAPGSGTNPAAKPQGGMDIMSWMLPLLLVWVVVMMILPQRKEKKKREAMMAGLKKGDRVQTIGGILASVVEVRDQEVILKVDEASNTRMRFARSAIASVESDEPAKA